MVLIDVLGELLNHDLSNVSTVSSSDSSSRQTLVLFMAGLALLLRLSPRPPCAPLETLRLRERILSSPLRGEGERGVMLRRGDLESTERGVMERVRGRPRGGDGDAILMSRRCCENVVLGSLITKADAMGQPAKSRMTAAVASEYCRISSVFG